MKQLFHRTLRWAIAPGMILTASLLCSLTLAGWAYAEEEDIQVIEIKLGDYRFMPEEIQLIAEQPVILRFINTDSITPHNFTMKSDDSTVDIDVDIRGGKTIDVQLAPMPPGNYPFFCDKKMIFMKSHKDKGMVGRLIVTAD